MTMMALPNFVQKMRRQLRKAMVNNVTLEETTIEMPELRVEEPRRIATYYVPEIYSIICSINGRLNDLPYIEVIINHRRHNALLDSGASVSYLGTTTLRSLGERKMIKYM
uniref:Peptidase A2 domain-containing protein n=1 Tax=Heterorhabditis bacteriophora TaxID=37862 RepID=A0A1I7XBG6_HETBA